MEGYMKAISFLVIALASSLVLASTCSGMEMVQSVQFSSNSLSISDFEGYAKIRLQGCDLTDEIGKPQLPVKTILISIPQFANVEGIRVISTESEEIPGNYLIFPAQPPQILSMESVAQKPVEFEEPDLEVYSSRNPYPGELGSAGRTGNMLGYKVLGVTLYPVQYTPAEGRLTIHKRLEVRIKYSIESGALKLPGKRSPTSERFCKSVLKSLVLNEEELESEEPVFEPVVTMLPPDDYEYVVVTSAVYDSVFQRLADWKTKKGVPADVVTTEWIYTTYSGWDNAEKIRNFIKDAYANWGTIWVLLGGDTNIVPDRVGFAMECEAGFDPDEDSIRADLYYSDLDGTWDSNGNHIYGEVTDSVDLYTDVFVARASAEDLSEIQAFVNKVLTYERNPVTDYLTNMAFFAEVLWSFPYTDAAVFKDMIDDGSVPARFDITKLYERDGNENKDTVVATINLGQNIMNHAGHANYTVMSVGSGSLRRGTMDSLVNGDRIGFLYSIGCYPAAFDEDCIAEHFITNPDGGGMGFIGNSRYGWGSPGNPGYGFSDMFDIEFFNQLFNNNIARISATLAATKAAYAPRSHMENIYRWHQYQLNVLGEPEMFVWTDSLSTLSVRHPDSIPMGTSGFAVTVDDGLMPISGALVCLMKDSEVYERALTDGAGQVSFGVSPASPGHIQVTVTAQNFLPYEDSTAVFSTGPFVECFRYGIVDSIGNNDGVCNPGEKIWLGVSVKNSGNQAANSVDGVLSSSDPFVSLEETLATFGDLGAGDTALGIPQFEFSIAHACTNGHVAYLTLETTDNSGHNWSDVIGVTVATPILSCFGYNVQDSIGNGNDIPEPGETVKVLAYVRNSGHGKAIGVTALLSCDDPFISVPGSLADVGDIEPGADGWARFLVSIDAGCPEPHFPWVKIDMSSSDWESTSDSLLFVVGSLGLTDDVESGEGDWTYEGLWHITEHRSNSATHSWYCGHEDLWYYDNQMIASLTSPPFVIGPNPYLSFWHWYDMPIYGSDGLYIEIDAGSGWELIHFKGCGGALDSLLPGNTWFNEWYDLSSYGVGDSARIRFRFFSDWDDVGEGWYLDDINIGAECTGIAEVIRRRALAGPPKLYQNAPNPFTRTTTIYANNPGAGKPAVKVYDITGRLVNSLSMITDGTGKFAATWDGRTADGTLAPSGTYFYRLDLPTGPTTRKMILIR